MEKKKIIIIGAGPAGLTAGYEIINKNQFSTIILEKNNYVGGISCTLSYKGNRIDIGGHRFFSKSDKVMDWWLNILPLSSEEENISITYQNQNKSVINLKTIEQEDEVMLVRNRKSRIFYKRRFFDYPLKFNLNTFIKLGLIYSFKVVLSYLRYKIRPITQEKNLEIFFINRFGKKLYKTFFKSYTEKVWGVPCQEISAEWGRQRIKGLSITRTFTHFLKSIFKFSKSDFKQKDIETSLIERFLYPKFGPGQMWEKVQKHILKQKGEVCLQHEVSKIIIKNHKVAGVEVLDNNTNKLKYIECDYLISTMPVKELINALNIEVPKEIKQISEGLQYRDFITVGVLLKRLKVGELKDNWIYVQEADVKVGRIQIFNNWSEFMVQDKDKVWLGLEYFCYEADEVWQMSKTDMIDFAVSELIQMDFIDKSDFIDATVIKVPKTYPAYFGTYKEFHKIRNFLNKIDNLFLIGRNGMHKYNNQDHSMLTAMQAVENIYQNIEDKSNIWSINTEQEYHEKKST